MTSEEFETQLEKERDFASERVRELKAEKEELIKKIEYWEKQADALSTAKARFVFYPNTSLAT